MHADAMARQASFKRSASGGSNFHVRVHSRSSQTPPAATNATSGHTSQNPSHHANPYANPSAPASAASSAVSSDHTGAASNKTATLSMLHHPRESNAADMRSLEEAVPGKAVKRMASGALSSTLQHSVSIPADKGASQHVQVLPMEAATASEASKGSDDTCPVVRILVFVHTLSKVSDATVHCTQHMMCASCILGQTLS